MDDGARSKTGRLLSTMAVALPLGACAHLPFDHSSRDLPVRPASLQAQEDINLLLGPSSALASPGDAVVRVVGPQMTCTGTLIAEDLVLTAHHCVVERDVHGAFTSKPLTAAALQVELGGDYLPWGSVGLKAVLAPPCGEAGGRGDVAVLVLERRLVGMATMVLSEASPRPGERIYLAGFGRCALSPEGIRRREREGGALASVGHGTFEVEASVCPGDSGGPAFDLRTHEIVGVVSLSAMDYDEGTRGRSVFARVDEMPKLVAYARLVADGADPGDLPPLSCE
jgi:Trypsin